jgi:ABC-2 family transporter protein
MLTRIWLTYKQHRFETLAILVVGLLAALGALVEAYRLVAVNVPLHCFETYQPYFPGSGQPFPDAATLKCNNLVESFQSIAQGTDMSLVRALLIFVPIIGGIVFGAPLVARELEQGTAPLSWSLSGSRRRWLTGKVLAGVLLLVPVMLAVGIAADVLQGASSPGLDTHAAFESYASRGFIDVFWALAAFAGTFALGTMLGRTLPAVIVALVVCFFVRVAWEPVMSHYVLQPFAVSSLKNIGGPGYYSGEVDMWLYQKVYIDGKEATDAQVQQWYMQNEPPLQEIPSAPATSPDPGASAGQPGTVDKGGGAVQGTPPDMSKFPDYVTYGIPGAWYWNVVGLASGILLLGSLFCGAIAFVWVDRRRPY